MILTCERCETRFRLDESRLPAGGARVRCSRCKHAFFVNPGGAPPAPEIVHQAAEAALTKTKPPAPAPSWDLEEDPNARTAQSSASTRASLASESLGGDFEEESDWRFEDEMQLGDTGASLDLPNGEAPAPPSADPNDSSFAELGDPESWDLLSTTAAPSAPLPQPTLPPPPVEVAPKPVARAAKEVAPQPSEREERVAIEAPIAEAPPIVLEAELSPALRGGAWIGVALGIALACWSSLAPRAPAAAPQLGVVPVGALELDSLRVRPVENAWAGPIWVVSGELHNPSKAPQAMGAAVAVTLLDRNGDAIDGAAAVAQPALPEQRLREDDPAQLSDRAERAAAELASQTLAPDARVRVDAIFAKAAPRAARFAVDARPLRQSPPAPAAAPAPAVVDPSAAPVEPAAN